MHGKAGGSIKIYMYTEVQQQVYSTVPPSLINIYHVNSQLFDFFLHLFEKRILEVTFGTGFYGPNALIVIQPTVSKY